MSTHHLTTPKKRDYVIVSIPRDGKEDLVTVAQVDSVTGSSVLAYNVKDAHWQRNQIELDLAWIKANLGRRPPEIQVGRVNLSELFTTHRVEHAGVGAIHFSFKPEDAFVTKLLKGYDRALRWYEKQGLKGIERLNVIHEVYHGPSKYAGYVRASKDMLKHPSTLRLFSKHVEFKEGSLYYVLAHEFAHLMDFHLLDKSPKLKARWIAGYAETVKPIKVPKETRVELLNLLASADSYKSFLSMLSDNEEGDDDPASSRKESWKMMLEALRRTRGITARDISSVIDAGEQDSLKDLLPDASQCGRGEPKPAISLYATKNVHETFAEAVSYMAVGKSLPKGIESLVEASFQRAIKRLPVVLNELSSGSRDSDD